MIRLMQDQAIHLTSTSPEPEAVSGTTSEAFDDIATLSSTS